MTLTTQHIVLLFFITILVIVIVILLRKVRRQRNLRKYNNYLDQENWKLKEEIIRLKKKK